MIIKVYKAKRVLDLSIALMLLIILSPFFLLIVILQVIVYGKKIFFIQHRLTLGAVQFKLIKFRSMHDSYDANDHLLPDKSRVTGLGKFLRFTSLDELPSIFNVFQGNLSIVGPRPLPVRYYDLMDGNQRKRFEVKAGITGLAQLERSRQISWKKKIDLDLEYISRMSFILDCKIIYKTLFSLFNASTSKELGNKSFDLYYPDFKA